MRGTDSDFSYDYFIQNCKDKKHTIILIKTKKQRFDTYTILPSIFGCYTDIAWKDDNQDKLGNKNSFIFRLNED